MNRHTRMTNQDPRAAIAYRALVLGCGYGTGERLRLKAASDEVLEEATAEAKALGEAIRLRIAAPAASDPAYRPSPSLSGTRSEPPEPE